MSEVTQGYHVAEWRPIDSAPKTGRWVLLWWPAVTDAAFVGYYVGRWKDAISGEHWGDTPGPTHWMPLPPPPFPTSGQEKP